MTRPDIRNISTNLPTANLGNMSTRRLQQIALIVVHYDAQWRPDKYDPIARYKAQALYHIQKNWGRNPLKPIRGFGLMYHYRISGDGQIWQTQPEDLITWQANNANPYALGICCDCGENQEPTEAQLVSLYNLLEYMCFERPDFPAGRRDVWGHGELTKYGNATKCPGRFLPYVQRYRTTRKFK